MSKEAEEERMKMLIRIVLLILIAVPFAISVNGADVVNSGSNLDGSSNAMAHEVTLAETGITNSKHDFTFNVYLTPDGECSACHNIREGVPYMWARNLTAGENYFNQTENPDYVRSPTLYCYNCHDNHEAVDNDPDYRFFIDAAQGRYIPQDVAFDANMSGNLYEYDSSPLDNESGYYETTPPNTVPPTDGSPTGGHYIKSDASGLTGISRGDKLPCTDCHEPHGAVPTNEVFIKGNSWFPLGGKEVSNLKASTNTRSGTGTGRAICTNCHAYSDAGTSVKFKDVNKAYGSTDNIIHTPSGVIEHSNADSTPCTDCHAHNAIGCGGCHGYPPGNQGHLTHFSAAKGPQFTSCLDCHYFSTETHNDDHVDFIDGTSKNMATTIACDACHSPNGSFDGVQMAKTNWDDGVYNGRVFKPGKEKWCATCHDEEPAYSMQLLFIIDDLNATFDPYLTPPPGYSEGQPEGNPPYGDATTQWAYWWGAPTEYGTGQRITAAGNGSRTATWTPDILVAGEYSVYVWWIERSNRVTTAPYTINYDGGSETTYVNQKENGGKWNYLGTYTFAAGTSGNVVLTNNASGGQYVSADAAGFKYGIAAKFKDGIYAPNVVGDNTTYGFYVTGHKINCLSCHDASKNHTDHEHRTYDVDDSTGQAINPYSDGYRLQGTNSLPSTALCLDCHNGSEVLGVNLWDVNHTNFWGTNVYWSKDFGNSHNYHLRICTSHFDSDWDGVVDSTESCIACHNVHGSSARRMVRHGELISTYGTTDKVPALDFGYLVPETGPATATWPAPAGTYYVYAWWHAHLTRATNAPYTINHSDGSETIPVNQQINGSQWNQLGIGTYAFVAGNSVVLSNEGADGYVIADAIGFDINGDGNPEIIVDNDNSSVTYSPEPWYSYSNSSVYGADAQYHSKIHNIMNRNATLQQSVGGRMDMAGRGVAQNGVCAACHPGISYERSPKLGPKVIGAKADPKTVAPDGVTQVLLTAVVLDHDHNVSSVTVNLSSIGGSDTQPMYDNGTHGDVTANDNIFSFETTVPDTTDFGTKRLRVTAIDGLLANSTGEIELNVLNEGMIIVDDPEATFVPDDGTWLYYSGSQEYGDYFRYKENGTGSATATWVPDIPEAGDYKVCAWWDSGSPERKWRSENVTYTIHHSAGSTTVVVDQTYTGPGGGKFVLLGTFAFNAGTYGYVVLDDGCTPAPVSGGTTYVIADAVMFEPAWLTPTAIQCYNLSNAAVLIDSSTTIGNTHDSGTEQYVVFDLGANYTVPKIKMYTSGNSYTWNVFMGNDTSGTCCSYSNWGTPVLEDWATHNSGWNETDITPTTARYLKLMRSDGSGDLAANSLFEFMFDPPAATLTYELHSYADMHIYDPMDRHVGMNYSTGKMENNIPGAVCSFGAVETVSLPKLADGDYRVLLKGTGRGVYGLIVTGESEEEGVFASEVFARRIAKDEMHDGTTGVDTTNVTNVTITVEKPPEPTLQVLGVANVTLAGLYPEIERVEMVRIQTEDVNTVSMPELVEAIYSAYMIASLGSGEFALRFNDVVDAVNITAVYNVAFDGSWTLLPSTVNGSTVEATLEAGDSSTVVFTFALLPLDTGTGRFPSIAGEHKGVIEPKQPIKVSQLYTYPCEGTGGHTEYVRIENETWDVTATWDGYSKDWQNVTFDDSFVLLANKTYSYTIRTGSYPQIIHKQRHTTLDGSFINCTEFRGVNGNVYHDWIPAIRLWSG